MGQLVARLSFLTGLLPLLLLGGPSLASAAPPARPSAHALLVASHRPGPGQAPLRFAGQDASRVAALLVELGGYPADQVRQLTDPTAAELLAALRAQGEALARHRAADEPAELLFYYSGHARARSLTLGEEELPLARLRQEVASLQADFTLIVLDACQSGAISGVKGAQPAADFSSSSVAELAASGLAVMASSTGSELSQESATLAGSFFTHHLLAGLRGAADQDRDGQVSLHEAYRYSYHRTLVATASTAIGRQHVTLEPDLRGRGEAILTRPALAEAALDLPAELGAELLLSRQPDQLVVAELHKAPGEPVRLALPAGSYQAFVRRGELREVCQLTLAPDRRAELELSGCQPAPVEQAVAKGEHDAAARRPWALELGVGLLLAGEDGYDERLQDFGWADQGLTGGSPEGTLSLSVLGGLAGPISLAATGALLDSAEYRREVTASPGQSFDEVFSWRAYRLGLELRASRTLGWSWLGGYVQAGGGLALGTTLYQAADGTDEREHFWGYHLAAAAGLQVMPWRHLGGFVQAGFCTSPVVDNLLGDTHDSGGPSLLLGLRGEL